MSYEVKQGNIFGRVGSGIGKGLAEQIPKEIERSRLASGLKELGEKKNLTPFQQLSEFYSIPGAADRPELIRSGTEFLRQQARGNAYGSGAGGAGGMPTQEEMLQGQETRNLNDVQFGNRNPRTGGAIGAGNPEIIVKTPNVPREEVGQSQIVNENPTQDKYITKAPWSPQKRDAQISKYIGRGFLTDQAERLAADDERRELESPSAYQKGLEEQEQKAEKAKAKLVSAIEEKTQKFVPEKGKELLPGTNLHDAISGDMLNNLKRGMERDLVEHPNATEADIIQDWSNRALELAKAKSQFEALARSTGPEAFFKGSQTYQKLKEYSDIFRDADNSEEYSKFLQADRKNGGMGLSPQGAAFVAYPPSPSIKKYIKDYKIPVSASPFRQKGTGSKIAADIEKYIDTNDSLLSIARAINDKDPYFNQSEFFNYLSKNKERLRLNDRQRREIAQGQADIIPNWGDILVLPFGRK